MPIFLHFLLVLPLVVLTQAQNQSGFISIDCGLPENSSYTQHTTGINYISDAKFVDAGVSRRVSPAEKITLLQQLRYVRSFPNGVRNCYRINVASGTKYLIRATFYYGNYDDLNKVPQFDLHLGANFWDTVKFPNASRTTISEIVHTPLSQNYIHLCLVNTGAGTPFISAIELRILNNNTYNTNTTASLSLLGRYDIGSITNLEYRYKDDVYDRIWMPYVFEGWTPKSTSYNNPLQLNDYEPPAVVMNTAATPVNASAPLELSWDPDTDIVNEKLYIYMHFNEIEKLPEKETREFNILINGYHWYGPMVPPYQRTYTIFSRSALTPATSYRFSLVRTENSTLPPILNALEIYMVKDFSKSETQQDDETWGRTTLQV
ncbi:Malectin-like carbohydrate-binding domain [Sesbania bispinosa]|nr:Malectin-like carbohydrate-binding domain [Sesbania bispinosa]